MSITSLTSGQYSPVAYLTKQNLALLLVGLFCFENIILIYVYLKRSRGLGIEVFESYDGH